MMVRLRDKSLGVKFRHSFALGEVQKEASLLLILKWGGELTPSGRSQAEELGKVFRCMYPGGQGKIKMP